MCFNNGDNGARPEIMSSDVMQAKGFRYDPVESELSDTKVVWKNSRVALHLAALHLKKEVHRHMSWYVEY